MSIFDRLEKQILEQETITCPFCNSGYVCKEEFRVRVQCTICKGMGYRAEDATATVQCILERLPDLLRNQITLDMVERYIRKLGPGYYRAEYRSFWKELHEEIATA